MAAPLPCFCRHLERLTFLAQHVLLPQTAEVLEAVGGQTPKTDLITHYNTEPAYVPGLVEPGSDGDPGDALVFLSSDGEIKRPDQVRCGLMLPRGRRAPMPLPAAKVRCLQRMPACGMLDYAVCHAAPLAALSDLRAPSSSRSCLPPSHAQVRLSTVDNYSSDTHGVWHPDNLPLRMTWYGSGNAGADGCLTGDCMNPWAAVPANLTVDWHTERLPAADEALQWALPLYDSVPPCRGNQAIARQDERPQWLSKPAFLEFGVLRAYPLLQVGGRRAPGQECAVGCVPVLVCAGTSHLECQLGPLRVPTESCRAPPAPTAGPAAVRGPARTGGRPAAGHAPRADAGAAGGLSRGGAHRREPAAAPVAQRLAGGKRRVPDEGCCSLPLPLPLLLVLLAFLAVAVICDCPLLLLLLPLLLLFPLMLLQGEGESGVLATLHAELSSLAAELEGAQREHSAVALLGELAAYFSAWHPPLRAVARRFASAASRWADELERDAQEAPPDAARPLRAKQCLLHATALLCLASGSGPMEVADAQAVLELAAQVRTRSG